MASPLRGRNDEVEAQRRRWTFYEVINLGLGMGTAGRFAKGPAGIHAFSGETKMDSNKEGVRPPAPPKPLQRPPPPDFAKRTAFPVPCQNFAILDSLCFFEK